MPGLDQQSCELLDGGAEARPQYRLPAQLSVNKPLTGHLAELFPDLIIDANGETCPGCGETLGEAAVVQGWEVEDANNYTTQWYVRMRPFEWA